MVSSLDLSLIFDPVRMMLRVITRWPFEPAARSRVDRPHAAVLRSSRQTVQPADRLHGCYPLERRNTGQPISVRHDAGGAPSRGPTR